LSGGRVFLTLLLDLHVVTDRAADRRAGDCMVPSNVATDTADGSAAKAAGGEAWASREHRNENERFQSEHGSLQDVVCRQ